MNLKSRIRRLEERRGLHRTRPPIAFFDQIVDNTVTQEEWQRWLPWISRHFAKTEDSGVADHVHGILDPSQTDPNGLGGNLR